jgi:hypothetical protein
METGLVGGVFATAWVSCGCPTTVLPDGCVDVVWVDGELIVAGPATRAVAVPASLDGPPFGVRLKVAASKRRWAYRRTSCVTSTFPWR